MPNSKKTAKSLQPSVHKLVVELAGVRRRFASLLYEALLLLGVLGLLFMLPWLMVGTLWSYTPPGLILWVHLLVALGFYFLWYWVRRGQTLAMQTWQLCLVRAQDGKALGWQQALFRYLLCWPSLLLGGIGLWWALFDPERQFLHDRIAGSRVVFLPKKVDVDSNTV